MPLSRTRLLLGQEAIDKLKSSHVIVFGVGGVGGYAVEALVRSGVGKITVVDDDVVSISNLNRQIIALRSTVGRAKVDVVKERALDINPEIKIHTLQKFVLPENIGEFDFGQYDFVVDCIDTVSAKISIIENVVKLWGPDGVHKPEIITCLGTGNKLNPMGFEVSVIEKTSVCPLARVMRKELKDRGIREVKCVYSKENPIAPQYEDGEKVPGSVSFVPPAAGLLIASEVVKTLIQ